MLSPKSTLTTISVQQTNGQVLELWISERMNNECKITYSDSKKNLDTLTFWGVNAIALDKISNQVANFKRSDTVN